MNFPRPRYSLFLLVSLVLPATAVGADIFEYPVNLKVLPEDISPRELSETMRAISIGTGLRCSNCHVGEEGQDLKDYDFESDEKDLKKTARKMLRMVRTINDDHLASAAEDPVRVECVTCHRGVQKPKMLGQVLTEAGRENGAAGVREAYTSLRKKYYGSHSYDFTEMTLSTFVRAQAGLGNPEQAAEMLDIMLEENPRSFNATFLYGELKLMQGDRGGAIAYLEKALELNPQAGFVQQRLQQVKKQVAEEQD